MTLALLVALAFALGGLAVAHRKDKHGNPLRMAVGAGAGMTLLALVLALAALPAAEPRAYTLTLAGTLTSGLAVVHAASSRSVGWTSLGEAVWSAWALSWTSWSRPPVTAVCLAAGGFLGAWAADTGAGAHGLLAGLVALAPARAQLRAAWTRETTRTRVERALAGALSGGLEWDQQRAAMRGAPVKVRFDAKQNPVKLLVPLPPSWRSSAEDRDREELRERLSAWGQPWRVLVNASKRVLLAERAAPLPTLVEVPGDVSWEWIQENAPSPLAMYLGQAQDPVTGETTPLWWDPDATDPHALVGGKTKSGKSVLLVLLIAQAVLRGWEVVIVDPKGVDFVWAGRLPGVRFFPGEDCLAGVREAVGEMRERQDWLQRRLWGGNDGDDEQSDLLKVINQPYSPCLVIVDEAAEVAGLGDKDEQAETAEGLSTLARLSRFSGMALCLATQRPDVKFVSGEMKANLGTRVLFGSAGSTMTTMVTDKAPDELPPLTAPVRGRGRAVIADEPAEFQGGYTSPSTVKELAGGVLPPEKLAPVRFVDEPQWRSWVRGEATESESVPAPKPHPDLARVSAELDAREVDTDAQLVRQNDDTENEPEQSYSEPETEPEVKPEPPVKSEQKSMTTDDILRIFEGE